MKEKFRLICVPIIILSSLTFLAGIILGIFYNYFLLIGGCLMIVSIVFTVVAMLKSPLFSIGAISVQCISRFFISYGSYLYVETGWITIFLDIALALSIIYVCYGVCLNAGTTKEKKTKTQPVAKQPEQFDNLSCLMNLSQELQQYKSLLDNGILTETEFAAQKAKIMRKYGLAIPQTVPVRTKTGIANNLPIETNDNLGI